MTQISNRRNQLRRSTTTGVIPTIPGSGVTSQIEPDNTWLTTDLMVGELFTNVVDSRVWFRSIDGIYELGYSGQTGDFISLSDAPSTYLSQGLKGVRVDSGETGLEFYDIEQPSTFVSLTDTPSSFMVDKYLVSNSSGTALEWEEQIKSFLQLNDTPTSYTVAGYASVINSEGTGLTFVNLEDIFVTLGSVQTIASAKTFTDATTFSSDISVGGSLTFDSIVLTDISTDTGLTFVDDVSLPTTRAVRYYVDSLVFGTGVTNYVDLDTTQTITGTKTFDDIIFTNANIPGNILITGNTYNDLTSYVYYGSTDLDGSYRTYIDGDGELITELRTGGVWAEYGASGSTTTLQTALYNGNESGGFDIIMNSGDLITSFDELTSLSIDNNSVVVSLSGFSQTFQTGKTGEIALLSDVEASDTLSEVLSNGNTTSGNDIYMSSGDTIHFGENNHIKKETYSTLDVLSFICPNDDGFIFRQSGETDGYFRISERMQPIINSSSPGLTFDDTSTGYISIITTNSSTLLDININLPSASGTIALTSDIAAQSAATNLSSVLGVGNTTSGNDIEVTNGDYLRIGDTDSYFTANGTTITWTNDKIVDISGPTTIDIQAGTLLTLGDETIISTTDGVMGNSVSSTIISSDKANISYGTKCNIIGGSNSTISGATNTTIIGCVSLTAIESNKTYINNLEINDGSRTIITPNTSGTIALSTDEGSGNYMILTDVVDGTDYKILMSGGTFVVATV